MNPMRGSGCAHVSVGTAGSCVTAKNPFRPGAQSVGANAPILQPRRQIPPDPFGLQFPTSQKHSEFQVGQYAASSRKSMGSIRSCTWWTEKACGSPVSESKTESIFIRRQTDMTDNIKDAPWVGVDREEYKERHSIFDAAREVISTQRLMTTTRQYRKKRNFASLAMQTGCGTSTATSQLLR